MSITLRACGVMLCAAVATSQADIINISGSVGNSTEQTGATFSGTVQYTYGGGNSGTVVFSLTNDTPVNVGGYLTGFVFNISSGDGAAAAVLTAKTNVNFLDTGNESAPPFGTFDAGAALGADWTGGGAPQGGIAVGASDSFTFSVTASDAGSLSALSFVEGPNDYNFVARFRGLTNGGSDKVPVPAPAGAAVLGVGAMGMLRRRR